jgi:hypothetical protein
MKKISQSLEAHDMPPAKKATKTCWLCLRIKPKDVLQLAHKVWANSILARDVAAEVSKLIESCYQLKPYAFCSGTTNTVVAGIFYILSFRHWQEKTVEDISNQLGMSRGSIRKGYHLWIKQFPELFPDFKLGLSRLKYLWWLDSKGHRKNVRDLAPALNRNFQLHTDDHY